MKLSKLSLANKVLLALIIGVLFGFIANLSFSAEFNDSLIKWVLDPAGNVFLRGIKMIVVPLVFFSLICGAASVGDVKKLGRVGGKIFVFYMFTTALAITIALTATAIIKPGVGINMVAPGAFEAKEAPFIMDIFVNMIPTNPIESLVKGDMLQIIVFALIFGISMTLIGDPVKPLLNVIDQANNVFLKVIGLVMLFAPYGVFALISKVVIAQGPEILGQLLKYALTIIFVLIFHQIVTYGTAIRVLGKVNPIKFFKKFWPVMVFAFSTSSSNATIPVTLESCEKKLGISDKVASFTIPLGATINMDGTAIMQGVAAAFIAQLYGIDLTMQQQLMIILTATLASVGTAGVPGAGIVMLSMVLQQVNLPVEGIAIILSVDRVLDMMRTSINVTGDAAGSLIVARSEGELDLNVYNS
jgi:Na+/H+-dicarboxylate symporter